MVRMFMVTRKSDKFNLFYFRFQSCAQKCIDEQIPEEKRNRYEVTYKDVPISDFPEWSWFWHTQSPGQEWKEHIENTGKVLEVF